MNKEIAFHPTNSNIVDFMVDTLSIDKTSKIIDTGYGTGAFLDGLLKKEFKDIEGIEFSTEFYNSSLKKEKYKNINLFHGDYLSFKKEYDAVIGNPPYIKSSKLDKGMKSVLKELTNNNSSDIYYGFIINSILNLKNGGELIYILPSTFFTNKYASYLRDFMMDNGSFEYIVDFGELPIFDTANVEAIIFKYIKGSKRKNIEVFKINKRKEKEYIKLLKDSFENKVTNELFDYYEIEQFNNGSKWNLSDSKYTFEKEALSNYVNVGVGIVSGCDSVFTLEDDNQFNSEEKKYFVRNFLKAKNLSSYVSSGELTKMLFIPSKIDNIDKLEEFHNIVEYLEKNKETLEDRYFSSDKKPYFYWLAIRNLEEIEANKNNEIIAVPSMSRKKSQWFSISYDSNRYISGDIMYISPKKDTDIYFILGLLNSDFFAKYYNHIGVKKGERFIFTQGFLSEIKIPKLIEKDKKYISKITKEIIEDLKNKKPVNIKRENIDKIINTYLS